MERGASYSLHEDGTEPPAKPLESLLQGGAASASGYQPPSVPLHRGVAVPAAHTGRIIDRADTLFQRSKGRWKCVCCPAECDPSSLKANGAN